MLSGKTIFVVPLDWGLGHATRCVPIIRSLEKKNTILIGTTPLTHSLLHEEFPHLVKITVPPYSISYSKVLPVWLKLLLKWPDILSTIKKEHHFLERQIDALGIDVIISDNRFGLFSNRIHSILITHQVFLKTPFAPALAQRINKKYILKFNEVWIPDYEDVSKSLAGELSHGKHFHTKVNYLGPLTRLNIQKNSFKEYDMLFLLSGPEPQQSLLGEKFVSVAAQQTNLKFAIVSNSFIAKSTKNLFVFENPHAITLSNLISTSSKIVCRSGYSSLMDLYGLKKEEIILIPTKGQTEQEYLAEYWKKNFGTTSISEKELGNMIF